MKHYILRLTPSQKSYLYKGFFEYCRNIEMSEDEKKALNVLAVAFLEYDMHIGGREALTTEEIECIVLLYDGQFNDASSKARALLQSGISKLRQQLSGS